MNAALSSQFRGEITVVNAAAKQSPARPDDLSLAAMAKSALNYLRGNPDPSRNYECKFSLGPLGIPSHVPFLPPNKYAYDPIALGDTDCRMDWQYSHMREMAGEPEAEAVERGVRQRIRSYRRADHLVWMNPAAWVGPPQSPSGIEALHILRTDPATAHIPVVALSANAMPRDIETGLAMGFFRYLTKPIKVKEFMDTLNVALAYAESH